MKLENYLSSIIKEIITKIIERHSRKFICYFLTSIVFTIYLKNPQRIHNVKSKK